MGITSQRGHRLDLYSESMQGQAQLQDLWCPIEMQCLAVCGFLFKCRQLCIHLPGLYGDERCKQGLLSALSLVQVEFKSICVKIRVQRFIKQ